MSGYRVIENASAADLRAWVDRLARVVSFCEAVTRDRRWWRATARRFANLRTALEREIRERAA